ncbi:MAG: hypothetical protein D6744_18335 [Planctomycetota bacterium]|nr:MAG: hypothetical protein D6744_18335 [Planctomycetota bacterium]
MIEQLSTDEVNAQRGYVSMWCPRCQGRRLCVRVPDRHVGHLLLSVFTLGAWIPFWISLAVYRSRRPYGCMKCGKRLRPPA